MDNPKYQHGGSHYHSNQDRERAGGLSSGSAGNSSRRSGHGSNNDYGALGRLPGSANHANGIGGGGLGSIGALGGGRRTASGEHRYGIQGGVLGGVASPGTGNGLSGSSTSFERRRAGMGTYGSDEREAPAVSDGYVTQSYSRSGGGGAERDRDRPALLGIGRGNSRANLREEREPLQPRSAGPSWTSNRWRHLQPEDDSQPSSGRNSPANEDAPESDPWQTNATWKPAQSDPIELERPRAPDDAKPAISAQEAHDARARSESRNASPAPGRTAAANLVEGSRPGLSTSVSNPALLLDDLLIGPARAGANVPPSAIAAINSASALSSRSNSITAPLSHLSIGTASANEPFLGSTPRAGQSAGIGASISRPGTSNGHNMTPTRAAAVEGLELLARRSPVQEISMAHLQQQFLPRSQPTPPPPAPVRPQLTPDQIFWQYRDPSGQLQGPFSAVQMQDWYVQGFFSETLLVKRVESVDFETLGALISRIGDVHKPFLSAPVQKMYAPPGIGIGQPPLGQSPLVHRTASPAQWHTQQQQQAYRHAPSAAIGSQPASRNASISSSSLQGVGSIARDLLTPQPDNHIYSPQPSFPQQYSEPQYSATQVSTQAQQETVSLDPWADMSPAPAPASSAVQRGSSALGGDSVALDQIARRVAQTQQVPGPISPVVTAHRAAAGWEAAPSPIGRGTVLSAVNNADPTEALEQQSPAAAAEPESVGASDPWGDATAPAAADALKTQPASTSVEDVPTPEKTDLAAEKPAAPAVEATRIIDAASNKKGWSTNATPAPPAQTATVQKPSTPVSTEKAKKATPSAPLTGKVSTTTQEAFDKQKKGEQPLAQIGSAAAKNELSLSTLVSGSAPASAGTPPVKSAPWAKASGAAEEPAAATPSALPSSTSSLSLREIQAKEQREAEIRRAQEKKLQAARTAAEEAAEAERVAKEAAASLPASSRWGDLASAPVPAASSPAASPWAKPAAPAAAAKTASGTVKRTLKEIQEEEARKKKEALANAQAQSAALSKGYATSIGQNRSASVSRGHMPRLYPSELC